MKIQFRGPFNHALLLLGIASSMFLVALVFRLSEKQGPAADKKTGRERTDACSGAILVTVAWCVVYYNYTGLQVFSVFCKDVWEIWTARDVTPKFSQFAARFSGNMFEQGPVFLFPLWLYTVFADYETGANLGYLYLYSRMIYPFYYIFGRRFTFWFETCTQIGYGVNGVFLLGILVTALGGDWVQLASEHPIGAPVAGFLTGSCALVPGVPLTIPYLFLAYKADHREALLNFAASQPAVELTAVKGSGAAKE